MRITLDRVSQKVERKGYALLFKGEDVWKARRYKSYAVESLVGRSLARRISAACNVGSITPATLNATLS